jgi:hypothetical protein
VFDEAELMNSLYHDNELKLLINMGYCADNPELSAVKIFFISLCSHKVVALFRFL